MLSRLDFANPGGHIYQEDPRTRPPQSVWSVRLSRRLIEQITWLTSSFDGKSHSFRSIISLIYFIVWFEHIQNNLVEYKSTWIVPGSSNKYQVSPIGVKLLVIKFSYYIMKCKTCFESSNFMRFRTYIFAIHFWSQAQNHFVEACLEPFWVL